MSTRGDYACRALLSLGAARRRAAGRRRSATSPSAPALPQPYLEQILLALKGAGLVRSKRGVGGGYVLARPPEEIRLSEILSAVDGPITLGDFGEPHQDGACDHEGQCVLLAIWNEAGEQMRRHLDGFTLPPSPRMARATPLAGQRRWSRPRPRATEPVARLARPRATSRCLSACRSIRASRRSALRLPRSDASSTRSAGPGWRGRARGRRAAGCERQPLAGDRVVERQLGGVQERARSSPRVVRRSP